MPVPGGVDHPAGQLALPRRKRLHRDELREPLAQPDRGLVVGRADRDVGELVPDQPVPRRTRLVEHPRVHDDAGGRELVAVRRDRHRERDRVEALRVAARAAAERSPGSPSPTGRRRRPSATRDTGTTPATSSMPRRTDASSGRRGRRALGVEDTEHAGP